MVWLHLLFQSSVLRLAKDMFTSRIPLNASLGCCLVWSSNRERILFITQTSLCNMQRILKVVKRIILDDTWPSKAKKRCLCFDLLAFLSTLFYLCKYYSLTCAKTHRGGCQVCKCFWASEIGQRSTKCKILKTSI